MELTDTHCHVHSVDYPLPITEVDAHCLEVGVTRLIAVGCDAADSQRAVDFAADRPNTWAVVGQHPHEAKYGEEPLRQIRTLIEQDQKASSLVEQASKSVVSAPMGGYTDRAQALAEHGWEGAQRGEAHDTSNPSKPHFRKIVGIGECGLDYFYSHSEKGDQEKALRYQIELALEYNLPLVFHVREAFDDFWPIFDSYQGIRGELHSYTDDSANLSKAIERGLYIGVNGIMTFTKNDWQLEVAKAIPLNKILLETDAPFLTPKPLRGTVNEPAHVLHVARFLSDLRQVSLSELAQHTTTNARQLFSI